MLTKLTDMLPRHSRDVDGRRLLVPVERYLRADPTTHGEWSLVCAWCLDGAHLNVHEAPAECRKSLVFVRNTCDGDSRPTGLPVDLKTWTKEQFEKALEAGKLIEAYSCGAYNVEEGPMTAECCEHGSRAPSYAVIPL